VPLTAPARPVAGMALPFHMSLVFEVVEQGHHGGPLDPKRVCQRLWGFGLPGEQAGPPLIDPLRKPHNRHLHRFPQAGNA
jgi:hypothetical protein